MEIRISLKQLGKKHPVLQAQPFEIHYSQTSISLETLLILIIQSQVEAYNARKVDKEDQDTSHRPLEDYMTQLLATGKAGFGNVYNENKADLEKAQQEALQAYEDGMFAVFYGEEELSSLSQTIDLSKSETFTFLRLTFLAGSIW